MEHSFFKHFNINNKILFDIFLQSITEVVVELDLPDDSCQSNDIPG